MSRQEYQNNNRREQEQLDAARALLEDATRDTVLWLQANPSAEEKTYVLATQERLADLARIIDRRMERRKEPRDDWQWSEGVREVLSRLLKAKEARGGVVGKSWDRFAKRLPRHLPGSRPATKPKTKLPEPIKPVNTGFTSVSLPKAPPSPREVGGRGAPYQPNLTEVPHEPPMYFSSDLWPKTNVILLKAQRGFPRQTQTVELCKRIVSEMTPLFVEAVGAGRMKPANVLREHGGGMEDLLLLLLIRNDPDPYSGWAISHAANQIGQEVRRSDEWLRLGEAIEEAQRQSIEADGFRTDEKQTRSSRVQNGATPAQDVESKSPIGRNIDRLRKDCGWSFDELVGKTGMDKKSILAHVNEGRKPRPRTMKEYAQAFSKALQREITVADLEK